jgi:hypothetical protein
MFERISQAAETFALRISRRDFFGWAGKSALALAGVLAVQGGATAQWGGGCTSCKNGERCCGGYCMKRNGGCASPVLLAGTGPPSGQRSCPNPIGRGCTNGKHNQLCCDGHWI